MLSTAVTGCGSGTEGAPDNLQDKIEVTGEYGTRPTIEIDAPLEFSESSSWTATRGDGDRVGERTTVILQLTIADGRTGKPAISTFDQGQRPLETEMGEQVFPSLFQALIGKRAGSRVVVASTAAEAYGEKGAPQIGIDSGDTVVMVADVLSTDPTSVLDGPDGDALEAPTGSPTLLEKDGVPTGFDFAGARKPRRLTVIPLREGTGPAVESPERVTIDHLGAVWGSATPFEDSFAKDPSTLTIGLSGRIKAWDQGLDGIKEGSRVLLIAPPGLAYGKEPQPNIPAGSTLVYVVDVLGVG